ncbi:MAG: hypothetical protein RLZZ46_993 [Bacteroidota bacterium]
MSLENRIRELEQENARLRQALENRGFYKEEYSSPLVKVPQELGPLFGEMQKAVKSYFDNLVFDPEHASIRITDERYVLVRASALSYDFFDRIRLFYADQGAEGADQIAFQMLFDLGHLIGLEDATVLHGKLKLKKPLQKLSAGPVHFALTGWASVEIMPDSKPVAGTEFLLKYKHPHSFEADSWIKAKKKAPKPVCIMNAGYSSGWCEASFGISLTAVEITCRAKGDESCSFIMAPPDQIHRYLSSDKSKKAGNSNNKRIPGFLVRKKIEEELKKSLKEKEILLKEVHHRVKNNLQIMSSLLRLQTFTLNNEQAIEKFRESEDRINAMALLHELLYRSGSLNNINISEYVQSIINYLNSKQYGREKVEIIFKHQLSNSFLNIDKAISCGLILNEIVTNALKYAFKETSKPKVMVEFNDHIAGEFNYRLQVRDNGCGIPTEKLKPEAAGFGLQIIHTLTGQLEGIITIKNDHGTEITILFN